MGEVFLAEDTRLDVRRALDLAAQIPEFGLFIEDPRLSMDGKQLIYSRGKITGDLWLLRFGAGSTK